MCILTNPSSMGYAKIDGQPPDLFVLRVDGFVQGTWFKETNEIRSMCVLSEEYIRQVD